MKIITLCRGGNVRSVAAKQILQRYLKHEVIAIGADNTNNETKKLVFDWADKIVVMNREFLHFLKIGDLHSTLYDYEYKSILLDVGNDIWGDPFNEDLQLKIVNILNTNPFFWDSAICNFKFESINPNKVVEKIRQYKEKLKLRNLSDLAI